LKTIARANSRAVNASPQTTAQSLGSLVKSARDIMRKDKGLNGDLDRLPMLTWIMFLKFLDDLELQREEEAKLAGKKFQRAIDPPYRWRDWAAKPEGITGDELISFVNNEETVLPDGSRGPGLFAYLRSLAGRNGGDRRDVIATVFKGTINRMINGYLLRDVINKVAGIHFGSSEELHTLGSLYESMLREMRDAAGDSGEFYTPRPVVRFMVAVTDPKLGETILDPACGTGGFLVEAFQHLEKQCKTVQDRGLLQKRSIFGGEAKPLPYLLAQMNLLLHGLDSPQISPNNSLAVRITEIGEKDRVDIILTNPPFGGEEERGILANFPSDKQTAETALLFLQLIMRKIRRVSKPGRAAVVVPNGTLFGDGVCARIKEELLKEFNLHTVVRLPAGVFAPYTGQETALLFFDRDAPAEYVWYYQHPLPPDRAKLKNPCYTKSSPLRFEEFAPLLSWWQSREETECAWKVRVADIRENGFNLDLHHPSESGAVVVRTRADIQQTVTDTTAEVSKASHHLVESLVESTTFLPVTANASYKTLEELRIDINPENRNPEKTPEDEFMYVDLSSVSFNTFEGVKKLRGSEAPSRARRVIREGDVILSTVRPYLCGHAVVDEQLDNQICSTGFSVLRCPKGINPKFLYYMLIFAAGDIAILFVYAGGTLSSAERRSCKAPNNPGIGT
jgi:type I restriction enzyme M protein